ncbi:MAG: hypothetical protein WCG27_11375, partial [Pseudomonadota bacterium]
MDRSWLIRTRQKKILGPVSREKLLDLFKKQSLGERDEVCSGDGFWFRLNEKEMVDRYLLSSNPQPHNLLSEAPTLPDIVKLVEKFSAGVKVTSPQSTPTLKG